MILVNLSQDKIKENPYISTTLLKDIKVKLISGKKIILYLNKRGEFNSLVCEDCQHIYKCKDCDISMSVHNYPSEIICHICGYKEHLPNKCIKCNNNNLKKVGVGTQQIEKILNVLLEKEKPTIFRFDTDSVKNKGDKEKALKNLETADIIIGTKMITTGFDFKGIGLIGVILLEQELQIPKYDTEEKVYSNIKQLIGRGGRIGEKTDIIIQSFIPENDIIKSITNDNYKDYFLKTLEERKLFKYPPFNELITIEYRHKSEEKALEFITNLYNKLQLENKDNDINIKQIPSYTKKYNTYHYKIILQGNNLREFIECIRSEIMGNKGLVVVFG